MRSVNPATEQLIQEYAADSREAVSHKLDHAVSAFNHWRELPIRDRSAIMLALADELRQHLERNARLITVEMGKPVRESRAELDKCIWLCTYYAENAERLLASEPVVTDAGESFVRYDPLGVVLGVMPWNFPFWQAFRFAIPTLLAGNTVLLKHASNVTGCALAMDALFSKVGLPPGCFAPLLVPGREVEGLIRDSRIAAVSVTGSTQTGREIGRTAGDAIKPSVLELGGSNPFVVLADADLETAVDRAIAGRMVNSGQSCIAAKRFIVEQPIHDEFVAAMRKQLSSLVVGDPTYDVTDIGPLARPDLVDALHAQVERSVEKGARCVLGGRPAPGPGYYYMPTLLVEVSPGMPAFDEETFGPLAAVTRASDTEQALALANGSPYGLGASVWTTAARGKALAGRLTAGCVAVNGIVKSDPRLPFGGTKASGYGRELARQGIQTFVNVKSVWIR